MRINTKDKNAIRIYWLSIHSAASLCKIWISSIVIMTPIFIWHLFFQIINVTLSHPVRQFWTSGLRGLILCVTWGPEKKVLVSQSCLTLCDPVDCSSSVHGILQAGILEWVVTPFSRRSSWPRDRTWVSCIAGRFTTVWATREAVEDVAWRCA